LNALVDPFSIGEPKIGEKKFYDMEYQFICRFANHETIVDDDSQLYTSAECWST